MINGGNTLAKNTALYNTTVKQLALKENKDEERNDRISERWSALRRGEPRYKAW